jgi:chromosome segregation ATPase
VSTSNIHIMRAEHQWQQRRVKQYMSLTDAKWRQLRDDRDHEIALAQRVEDEMQRLVAELQAANQRGDRQRAAEMESRLKEARNIIDAARARIRQREREMTQAQAEYRRWKRHLIKWDPQPVTCPQCHGDRVVSMHGRSGVCDGCDADVPLGAKPIISDGRVLQQRQAA